MTVMQDLIDDKRVRLHVKAAANTIYRRYRKWVTCPDLEQELWLWIMSDPTRARTLLDASETFLLIRLRTVAERYARREKAEQSGYRPADEVFYSLRRIEELLDAAFDTEATTPTSNDDPAPGDGGDVFGEWEAGVVDVRRALDRISSPLYATLRARHLLGRVVDPEDYRSALRALQGVLGGPRPSAT